MRQRFVTLFLYLFQEFNVWINNIHVRGPPQWCSNVSMCLSRSVPLFNLLHYMECVLIFSRLPKPSCQIIDLWFCLHASHQSILFVHALLIDRFAFIIWICCMFAGDDEFHECAIKAEYTWAKTWQTYITPILHLVHDMFYWGNRQVGFLLSFHWQFQMWSLICFAYWFTYIYISMQSPCIKISEQ